MSKRSALLSKRRRASSPRGHKVANAAPYALSPAQIPGVRVAYISGQSKVPEEIEAYWQSRGATFMHHSLEDGVNQSELGRILERADVVFHSQNDVSAEAVRLITTFCDRRGKPLIPLDMGCLSGLAEAFQTWCPFG